VERVIKLARKKALTGAFVKQKSLFVAGLRTPGFPSTLEEVNP